MTAGIQRSPQQFSESSYDIAIIGGGIYGAMLLLEAARKGLSAIMIERHDFGSGTTANNFRILHGGLRSLQSGDLRRYRESVRERRWFLRTFPDLVEPMRCLMPFYGRGLKRASVMKLASVINDLFSASRNDGVRADRKLGSTKVISREKTIAEFPMVNREGLKGGLVWHDATMPDCHRILIEIIHWASEHDAKALNYVAATGLISEGGKVIGVRARDKVSGEDLKFRATTVVSAVGPWTTGFLEDQGIPTSCFLPSRAWNVVLDRPPVSEGAVAVSAGPESPIYFIHSHLNKLFVGTGHREIGGKIDPENDVFPEQLLKQFLANINEAIPELDLKTADVLKTYQGFLPVRQAGTVDLMRTSTILDYGDKHDLKGLYAVVGVKFTTARATAADVIERVCRQHFPAARNVQIFDDEPRVAIPSCR